MPQSTEASFLRDMVRTAISGVACGLLISHAVSQPYSLERAMQNFRLQNLATVIAEAHHLDPDQFRKVIECESQWDPNVQSGYALPDGTQENSWGIAQFNLDTNDMTKEEALNPEFALTKMAEHWSAGRASGWICYRLWSARGWH
jgi:hypothetical protein